MSGNNGMTHDHVRRRLAGRMSLSPNDELSTIGGSIAPSPSLLSQSERCLDASGCWQV